MWMHVGKTDIKKGKAKNAAGSTRITRNTVPHSRVGRKAFATDMTTVGKTTQYAAIRHVDGSSFLHWRNRSLTYSTLQGSVHIICFGSKLICQSFPFRKSFGQDLQPVNVRAYKLLEPRGELVGQQRGRENIVEMRRKALVFDQESKKVPPDVLMRLVMPYS